MSALVLLNLLNELKKISQACQAFYLFVTTSLIHSRMLDSIYQVTSTLFKKCIFCRVNVKILPSFTQRNNDRHYIMSLVVYRFIA